MRETRPSGSEGGGTQTNEFSLPVSKSDVLSAFESGVVSRSGISVTECLSYIGESLRDSHSNPKLQF